MKSGIVDKSMSIVDGKIVRTVTQQEEFTPQEALSVKANIQQQKARIVAEAQNLKAKHDELSADEANIDVLLSELESSKPLPKDPNTTIEGFPEFGK